MLPWLQRHLNSANLTMSVTIMRKRGVASSTEPEVQNITAVKNEPRPQQGRI